VNSENFNIGDTKLAMLFVKFLYVNLNLEFGVQE